MRKRIHQILELAQPDDSASRWFDIFIIGLITLNLLAIALESVSTLQNLYGVYFYWFELFSVAIFSVEYVLRIWSCVEKDSDIYLHPLKKRLSFALTPMALIDLLAILPFYLSMFFVLDLRFLRILRLLRIFKLTRYSSAMTLLLKVLQEESRVLSAAFFILIIILIFASSGIHLFEHGEQPEAFGSIPAALWWAVATLTTVGYGDVTPVTLGGKIFGIFIMIIGVGMVALPAGILASAFSEKLHLRREEYESLAEEILEDGKVTLQEQEEMEQARIKLGLNEEDAERIFARIASEELRKKNICPHCNRPIFDRRQDD